MENIKQLLELNIEIEGLLRVAEYRESDTVKSLILAKSEKFLHILNAEFSDDKSYEDVTVLSRSGSTPHVMSNDTPGDITSTDSDTDMISGLQETGGSESINLNLTESAHDVGYEEIETVLEMEVPSPESSGPPIFNPILSQNGEEEISTVENQNAVSSSKDISSESSNVMRLDEMIHRQSSRDLKKAFSLNDRFRYIREIFGQDANYFDETINNLEMLSNLDEVYDYLLGDIGLNHEDETVKDFLAIIYNHFNP